MKDSFWIHIRFFFWVVIIIPVSSKVLSENLDNTLDKDAVLDTVIVTGFRDEQRKDIPKNVTVIDSRDIEKSTATQLVDLLSREANINLRTFTGNDKFGGIDIRGMGDSSSSNVLVLVDGVRLNNDDLSGPDLSSVPLSQIERIEIIRSGGSVRYGNGAVGGVVNIITKGGNTSMSAQMAKGSYSTEDMRFNFSNSEHDAIAVKGNLAYYDSEGYRDNGGLKKEDALFDLEYKFSDEWSSGVSVKFHRDEFGLPGTVSKLNYEGSSSQRKSTTVPEDGGESEEDLAHWRINYTPTSHWAADASLYYRDRKSDTIIQYSPSISKKDQLFTIEDRRHGGDMVVSRLDTINELESTLSLGSEFFLTDYQQYRNGRQVVSQSKKKFGNIEGQALFSEWSLKDERWDFTAGWRRDRSELEQDEESFKRICDYKKVIIPPLKFPIPVETNCRKIWVEDVSREEVWKNEAYETGYVYHFTDSLNGFIGFSKSFRNPNLDELLLSDGDLGPQNGKHWDVGIRFDNSALKWDFTVFSIVTEDEILYGLNPATSLAVNRNSDEQTRRLGAEADVRYEFMDGKLALNGNIGYVEAVFEESGNFVPLVPRVNSSAGIEWNSDNHITYGLTANYAGEQYDGNDFNNESYDKLESYVTVDAKVSWSIKNVEFFVSALNITDEVYSTSAYSGSYYPMPERNFMVGMKFEY